jgi:hypothetical protein
MSNLISVYIWAWKDYKSSEYIIKSVRTHYKNCEVFINVDNEGDHDNYKLLATKYHGHYSKNNIQVGYCGDHGHVKIGRECWPKENAFEWLNSLYNACKKSQSKYMLLVEEDDFMLRKLSILNTEFSMAIHASMPSAAGNWRPNYIPPEFLQFSKNHGGVDNCPGYGAGGGCVFNIKQFIDSWDKCNSILWDNYDYLKSINNVNTKIIGWEDFILQYVMMLGGYPIIQNFCLAQAWEHNNWLLENNVYGKPYEMVCGLSEKYADPEFIEIVMNEIENNYRSSNNA